MVCSIDFTWYGFVVYFAFSEVVLDSAQMITTAIAVSTDGAMVLGSGPTFGILLTILFTHGVVCSAATSILARLNLFYVIINGK